jgi:methylated-DNA-[protein]-cysteine S-methyltransferase
MPKISLALQPRKPTLPEPSANSCPQVAPARGMKAAPIAVGGAVGHNPISIIIPCHRVLGAKGQLIGYAGGLDRKRHLLTLESTSVFQ